MNILKDKNYSEIIDDYACDFAMFYSEDEGVGMSDFNCVVHNIYKFFKVDSDSVSIEEFKQVRRNLVDRVNYFWGIV